MKYIIFLSLVASLVSCLSIEKNEILTRIPTTNIKKVSVHIAYEYYLNENLHDVPLNLNSDLVGLHKDYLIVTKILKNQNLYSDMQFDSTFSEFELELNLKFKDSINLTYLLFTAATLYIIPFQQDLDLEITGTLRNRTTGFKKKVKKHGKMKLYFGPIPLLIRPFTESDNNREIMIKIILENILVDLEL